MHVRSYMLIHYSLFADMLLFLKSVPTLSCAEPPLFKYLPFMLSIFLSPSQTHILLQRSDVWDVLPGFHSAPPPHGAPPTRIP